jgi:hypothetical protein
VAWVRIHDGAMTHPKLIGLFNWRDPFHVWVWGLSHCQLHLTDGFIAFVSVPKMGRKAAAALVVQALWENTEGGWLVHDYFDWNDSRETITKKRGEARERMAAARERSASVLANSHMNKSRTSHEVLRGVGRVKSSSEGEREREPWDCPHVDRCESPQICANATYLGRPLKAVAS